MCTPQTHPGDSRVPTPRRIVTEMEIRAPEHFRHAAELSPRFASTDPRMEFPDRQLVVDLRQCSFVRPPAVLWCLVYPLLARLKGSECTLLVPENLREGQRFVCGVADGGVGIRHSLEQNPELRERVPYDWVAVELAVRERVTGTGEKTRGIGLYGVAEDMRKPGRRLIIHSGIGSLEISEDVEVRAGRVTLFPGTLTYASLPT